jgi:hypothetical protein
MSAVSLVVAMAVLMDVANPWHGCITVDTGPNPTRFRIVLSYWRLLTCTMCFRTAIFTSIRKDISLVLDQEQEDANADGEAPPDGSPPPRLSESVRSKSNVTGSASLDHVAHLEKAIRRRGSMCLEEEDLGELNSLRVT